LARLLPIARPSRPRWKFQQEAAGGSGDAIGLATIR
jgi:hypothetical protein